MDRGQVLTVASSFVRRCGGRLAFGLVLSVLLAWAVRAAWLEVRERHEQKQSAVAEELFRKRCRNGGDDIRAVERVGAVDALVWVTRSLSVVDGKLSDGYRRDDPHGRGCSLEECIAGLLRVSFGAASNPEEAARHAEGFRYVEALDPRDLGLYRYQAGIGVTHWRSAGEIDEALHVSGEEPGPAVYGFVLQREEVEAFSARYGVTWDDISTPDDREHGIAGNALTVFELNTGRVIGRRTGYTLGARRSDVGGAPMRAQTAALCPSAPPIGATASAHESGATANRDFALKVLR